MHQQIKDFLRRIRHEIHIFSLPMIILECNKHSICFSLLLHTSNFALDELSLWRVVRNNQMWCTARPRKLQRFMRKTINGCHVMRYKSGGHLIVTGQEHFAVIKVEAVKCRSSCWKQKHSATLQSRYLCSKLEWKVESRITELKNGINESRPSKMDPMWADSRKSKSTWAMPKRGQTWWKKKMNVLLQQFPFQVADFSNAPHVNLSIALEETCLEQWWPS